VELNRILIIEKDRVLAEKEAAALEKEGYKVEICADALEGIKKLYESYPDLIIASRELPMVKGEAAYQRIRQASYLPLIVIGVEEESAEILEFGADAYITRETDMRELVARVRSILRRKLKLKQGRGDKDSGDGNHNDPIDDPEDDPLDDLLDDPIDEYDGNIANYLDATEFHLASCLVLNKGKLLDYHRLMVEVWGGKGVSLNTLHNYMNSLSQKLPAFFSNPINILNYQDVGYCLVDAGEKGIVSI